MVKTNVKGLLSVLIVSISIVCCTNRQLFDASNDLSEVRKTLMSQQAAWNQGNIDLFMEGYWKDAQLSFIGSKGVTRGWNQTLANYKESYPDKSAMGILTFDVLELKSLGPSACYMIGKYTLEREKDSPSGYFNLLWEKKDGKWVIVSDHTSG